MDFTGKKVLITGASRGIGRATAVAFAKHGAAVAINFRDNSEAAKETYELLEGEDHILVRADIQNPGAVKKMVNAVIKQYGRIDILVNSAGIFTAHPIDNTDYEQWQKSWHHTIGINLIGVANTCYCVGQYMIRQNSGRIINVSSRGAFRGEPNSPAYGASKAGLNSLSQSLAQSLARYNISVTAVAPGFVETDMAKAHLDGPDGDAIRNQSPMKRVALPEEVAHGILFYASKDAAFMTGGILDINGASYLRS